eukprot:Tbor_TRINITY_DN5453_c0_g5::TRINITY_DN5453_c0_g5_i1::g.25357::m.25357
MYGDVESKVTFSFLTPLDVEVRCCPTTQKGTHAYDAEARDLRSEDAKFIAPITRGTLNGPEEVVRLFPPFSHHMREEARDKLIEITVHINLWKIRKKRVGTFWMDYEETFASLYRAVEVWIRVENVGLFSLCETTEGYLPIGNAIIRREDIITSSSPTVLYGNEIPMVKDNTLFCSFSFMAVGTCGLSFAAPPLLLAVDMSQSLYDCDRFYEANIAPLISAAAAQEVALCFTARQSLARKPLIHLVRPDFTTPSVHLLEANQESICKMVQNYDSISLPSFGVILTPQTTPYSLLNLYDGNSCNSPIPIVIQSTRRVDCFSVVDGDTVDDQHRFHDLCFFEIEGV